MNKKTTITFLIGIIFCMMLIYWYGSPDALLAVLKARYHALTLLVLQYPSVSRVMYCILYLIVTTVAFPGAAVLTIAGGAFFGLRDGILLTAFSATAGATILFLITRAIGKKIVEQRFPNFVALINNGFKQEGILYLLTLRLIPIIPFFVINLVCGITNISVQSYIILSFLGMLPGIIFYSYAGQTLTTINSLQELISWPILSMFILLACIPFLLMHSIRWYKRITYKEAP